MILREQEERDDHNLRGHRRAAVAKSGPPIVQRASGLGERVMKALGPSQAATQRSASDKRQELRNWRNCDLQVGRLQHPLSGGGEADFNGRNRAQSSGWRSKKIENCSCRDNATASAGRLPRLEQRALYSAVRCSDLNYSSGFCRRRETTLSNDSGFSSNIIGGMPRWSERRSAVA